MQNFLYIVNGWLMVTNMRLNQVSSVPSETTPDLFVFFVKLIKFLSLKREANLFREGRCDKQHGFRACGFTQYNIASGTVVIDSSGRRFFEEELARCDRRSYLCNGRKNSTAERCNQRNQLRLPKRFDVALRSRICEESGQDRDQVAGWISANGSCHEIRS